MAEFNAMANYDQMIPALVALACRRLGMNIKACSMMLDVMENMTHWIRTAHGDSAQTYCTGELFKVFGTGQGSGGSPAFWLAISDVMFQCINREVDGDAFSNPSKDRLSQRVEDAFVYDTSMTVDDRASDPVTALCHHLQTPAPYLYATPGHPAIRQCL